MSDARNHTQDGATLPGDNATGSSDDATVFRDATVLRDNTASSVSVRGQGDTDLSWHRDASGKGEADAPKVLKQRFVLEEKIGSGGMGTVFRARDLRKVEAKDAQPHVAVKVLNNDFRKHPEAFIALEREASKSQGLRHNNIVTIFDFDKDGDLPFITMELLQGEELADLLRRYPNGLPAELAWKVIGDMVAGVIHAHAEGVVHADFKPGNIFVTHEQTSKILDFGIARAIRANQVDDAAHFDPTRLAALTPAYASREMLNGDNAEPRDDIYSLGVVMYMVLAGRHPYGRLPATEAAHEGLQPERPKNVSLRRWWIIQKCLRFNRQERPESAERVAEALFGRPLWQRWGLAAGVGVLGFALLWSLTLQSTDITEVRQEVRQQTLVDAQVRQIDDLLAAPVFDGQWERTLLAELDELRHLDVLHSANDEQQGHAQDLFADYILHHQDLEQVGERYALAQEFGLGAVTDAYKQRLQHELKTLQSTDVDAVWINRTADVLERVTQAFATDPSLQAQRGELALHGQQALPELLLDQPQLAARVWSIFGASISNEQVRTAMADKVANALQASQTRAAQEQFNMEQQAVLDELSQTLNISCLRLDVDDLERYWRGIAQQHRAAAKKPIQARLNDCLQRLGALDPARAEVLAQQAQASSLLAVTGTDTDPCAAEHLVDNGRQQGRRGFCMDRLKATNHSGPRLVVVADQRSQSRFAISKYEISWSDFNQFCKQTGKCSASADTDYPVTGVDLATIQAYAQWLSAQSGYRYRLPTRQEWVSVAVGKPDPNRNCIVEVGGVRRGSVPLEVTNGQANPLGLVHIFGNARELVAQPDGVVSMGGGFNDPIEVCDNPLDGPVQARHSKRIDAQTGFRLVREVS